MRAARAAKGESEMIDAFKTNGNSPPTRPDLVVEHHGSIVILRGMTDAGCAWIEANVSGEGYQPFGLSARLAERRYVQPILDSATADGLTLGVS
jgi:hypothetical protein